MNEIVINADLGQAQISRHIYGHFAEHLGRCVYGGFWVGEDSSIPNTRGIRDSHITFTLPPMSVTVLELK